MAKQMYSKFPGTCATCGESFARGTLISWAGRGRGASHVCCPKDEPSAQRSACWECKSPEGRMRNYGAATPVYCDACEARIRPTTFAAQLRKQSAEDYPCSDLGYEDRCAEACGL